VREHLYDHLKINKEDLKNFPFFQDKGLILGRHLLSTLSFVDSQAGSIYISEPDYIFIGCVEVEYNPIYLILTYLVVGFTIHRLSLESYALIVL
jgi:hypothetical protein